MYGIGSNQGYYNQLCGSSIFGSWNSPSIVIKYPNQVSRPYGGGMDFSYLNSNTMQKLLSSLNDRQNAFVSQSQQQAASKKFYTEFNSTFGALKSAAGALKSFGSTSAFRPTGYGSTDGEVASVSKDFTSGTRTPINLQVDQTALAQSSSSQALYSRAQSLTGRSSLLLTNTDQSKSVKLDFSIASGTDNKAALQKMADAVNKTDLGIKATVEEKDGKSALVLNSEKTGTKSAFTASFTGSSAFQLSDKQVARDAVYSVDGGSSQVSQSNAVEVKSGLYVNLKGPGSAVLGARIQDDTKIMDAVKKFASSYNDALDFANSNSKKSAGMGNLAYSLGMTRFSSGSLSQIGIDVGSEGKLKVNESRLKSALKDRPNDVESLLGGPNGLATSTYGKTVNAFNNSRNLYPQASANTYSNFMYGRNMDYVSSYLSGMYYNAAI